MDATSSQRKIDELTADKKGGPDMTEPGQGRFDRMIAEVEDYAILLLDKEGTILTWNRGAEKIKGYTSQEIIGKSYKLFYSKDDNLNKLPESLLDEAYKKGKANHEGWRIRKDGSRFWGSITLTAIHDEVGNVTGFLKLTRDLTDKKISEDKLSNYIEELRLTNEELRKSEDRYHKMISEVKDYAIILLDKNGDIQNWNAGAESIKGYTAFEAIGKNFRIFYTPEDIEKKIPEKLLAEAEDKGKATSEGWRKKKDGTRFWGNVVITALHDKAGALIGFSKVTRDLTDKKIIEDALKKSAFDFELKNLQLEKLNSELASFAFVVSHDLKEPIRKIQVFAGRQLEENKSPEQMKEFAQKIISTAARMQQLMNALLSYTQISTNKNQEEIVDLNQVLESVKNDLEIVITETNADIKSSNLPVIPGVAFQMHQLFLNLLTNAIKFSKPGSIPEITISSEKVDQENLPQPLILNNKNYIAVSFTDSGIGFEQDQALRIFDVFQRLKPGQDSSGTGIGLSIVKKVTLNHDGYVVANSQPNEGATFKIYLPV